jgi:hypothetical protein
VDQTVPIFGRTDKEMRYGLNWEITERKTAVSNMLMTKFQGVMIIKIGSERRSNKSFKPQQLEYLSALEVSPESFTLPRAREG